MSTDVQHITQALIHLQLFFEDSRVQGGIFKLRILSEQQSKIPTGLSLQRYESIPHI